MKYTIIASPDIVKFEAMINEGLKKGWKLHGETRYWMTNMDSGYPDSTHRPNFYQTLVKDDSNSQEV